MSHAYVLTDLLSLAGTHTHTHTLLSYRLIGIYHHISCSCVAPINDPPMLLPTAYYLLQQQVLLPLLLLVLNPVLPATHFILLTASLLTTCY